jgi:hypothetical protein
MQAGVLQGSVLSRQPDSSLTLNGRNIPFVNSAKYLGVVFDKKGTWRLHIEMIEAMAFRTFIRIYSLLKSERLSANIEITLHKAVIRFVIIYASPAWDRHPFNEVAAPAKQSSQHHWKTYKAHSDSRFACGVQNSVRTWLYKKMMQATSRSRTKSWQWKCSQYWRRRSPT